MNVISIRTIRLFVFHLTAAIVFYLNFVAFEVPGGSKIILMGIALISILSLFVPILCKFRLSEVVIDKRKFFSCIFLAILIAFFSFDSISVSSFFVLLLSLIFGLVFYISFREFRSEAVSFVRFFILLNVFALFFQFFMIIAFSYKVDFHSVLYPFSESKFREIGQLSMYRFTGFFNEPGSYATYMSLLTAFYLSFIRRFDSVILISASSLLFTMSMSGVVFFCLFLGFYFYNNFRVLKSLGNVIIIFFSLFVLFGLFYYFGFYDYLLWRLFDPSVVDGTSNLKFVAIEFMRNADESRIIFGSGFFFNDCLGCESIQDVGFLFNLFFYFGFFVILFLILLFLIVSPINRFNTFLIFLVFISKMYIFSPVVWALLISSNLKVREK